MGTSPAGEDGGIVTQAPDRTTRSSVPRGILAATAKARGSGFAPAVPVLGHTHCVCAGTAVVFRKATHARRLPHGRGSGVLLVFPPSCLLDPPSSLFACRRSRASRKLLGRGAWAAPPSRLCFAKCLYLTPARRLEMILPRNGTAGRFPVVAQFPTLLRRPEFCFPASSFHLPSPARPRALEASGISLHRWH